MTLAQEVEQGQAVKVPMWIGGAEVDAAGGRTIDVLNPATGGTIATVPAGEAEDIDRAAKAAQDAATARGANMRVSAEVKSPDIIAVRIHHDLCPFCKKLDPQFAKLTRRTSGDSVLFITLDLTSEKTQQQAALLAGALGLEELWTGDLSRIGTVTFVDGKSKRVISSLRAVDAETMRVLDVKDLQTALRNAEKSLRGDR